VTVGQPVATPRCMTNSSRLRGTHHGRAHVRPRTATLGRRSSLPHASVRLTHRGRDPLVRQGGTTYIFVTDGIENALAQAKGAAGDKEVAVIGGAATIQQFIQAGLVDELRIHLVPVLLGDGTRLFDRMGPEHIELETTRIDSAAATHLTFQVVAKR
jgi:dihydrofolate reductase